MDGVRRGTFFKVMIGGIALWVATGSVHAGVIETNMAAVQADQSRSLLGEGKGVLVGIVDTGINDTHPALRGSEAAAKDFSGSGNTDDNENSLGHGTGVAGLIVGHDSGENYYGVAPEAKFLNAKVTDGDQSSMSDGTIWAAEEGAKVINVSVGNFVANGSTAKYDLICDYLTQKYGVLIVAAAGNESWESAVNGVPNGSYDGIAVGSTVGTKFQYVAADSSVALPTDSRSKPELVAPGDDVTIATANWETADPYTDLADGTSFASPIVAGLAVQMVGFGKAHKISTDPIVLKAVLMTSATHVLHNDGTTWDYRSAVHESDGLHILQPLDADEGAGQVNGVLAYDIYDRHPTSTVKYANWRESSLKENGQYIMNLGHFTAGQELDTALTWMMHVDRKRVGGPGLKYSDDYYQAASLADFSLTLLENGTRVINSDSYTDNFEYLSLTLPATANYSLEVYRYTGSGEPVEDYALAARVTDITVSGHHVRAADLAKPDLVHADEDSAVANINVPEPSGLGLVVLAVPLMRRKRRPGR